MTLPPPQTPLAACSRARTQRRVEADAHQVEPVVLHVFGAVERVLAPLERLVGRLGDQPVVGLGAGGVHDAGVALQVNDGLRRAALAGVHGRWWRSSSPGPSL